jgi:hypothetical protein
MTTRSIAQTLATVAFVGVTLTACGPSKVDQCNTLSTEINKASGLGKKFEAVGKEMSPANGIKNIEDLHRVSKEGSAKVKTLVRELDGFITSVKATELKDEKLVGYRDRAVTAYSTASKSLTQVADILVKFTKVEANEAGQKQIKDSLKDLQKATTVLETVDKDEKAISTEFNTYCGVDKK